MIHITVLAEEGSVNTVRIWKYQSFRQLASERLPHLLRVVNLQSGLSSDFRPNAPNIIFRLYTSPPATYNSPANHHIFAIVRASLVSGLSLLFLRYPIALKYLFSWRATAGRNCARLSAITPNRSSQIPSCKSRSRRHPKTHFFWYAILSLILCCHAKF